ncbi:hypothetical protein OIO90_000680 [Microbotryomycetes sp. JL221]|nr:hypothetical protein OIO90_000680 [Microbotryomycetes sp. JL221]
MLRAEAPAASTVLHRESQASASTGGRNKHASADGQPFIVTLQLDKHSHEKLTHLRSRHFPKHRNYLEAHITLFHALPARNKADYPPLLKTVAAGKNSFRVKIGSPFSLGGKGVGVPVTSPASSSARHDTPQPPHHKTKPHPHSDRITHVRSDLARALKSANIRLTPQDGRHMHAPHVTLQNKVDEETAHRSLEEVKQTWHDWEAIAEGLELYEYQPDGRWAFVDRFAFNPASMKETATM